MGSLEVGSYVPEYPKTNCIYWFNENTEKDALYDANLDEKGSRLYQYFENAVLHVRAEWIMDVMLQCS